MLKSCFFIGHRETSEEMLPAFMEAVERHIVDFGVSEFVVGNYGGFDSMAARSVIAAKKNHSDITLLLLLPYHPANGLWYYRLDLTAAFIRRAWKRFPDASPLSERTDI